MVSGWSVPSAFSKIASVPGGTEFVGRGRHRRECGRRLRLEEAEPLGDVSAVGPTVALRPIEASKAAVCYVRNTSAPAVRHRDQATSGSAGMRLRSDTSLTSMTSRIAAAASSREHAARTSSTTTATSASRSIPRSSLAMTMGSRGARKASEPPWYIKGSVQNEAGISTPRARRNEQAAAYCERLFVSFADYARRLAATPIKLLDAEKDAPLEYHDKLTVAKFVPTELRERLAAPASSFCVSGTSTGSLSCAPAKRRPLNRSSTAAQRRSLSRIRRSAATLWEPCAVPRCRRSPPRLRRSAPPARRPGPCSKPCPIR